MGSATSTNLDLLAWFSEEERDTCESCKERVAVTLPSAIASFCLGCGAISIDGVRIDKRRIRDRSGVGTAAPPSRG